MDNLPERVRTKISINNGCWDWIAVKDLNGYGLIMGSKKDGFPHKRFFAHRYVYFLLKGTPGPVLDHLCRRPCCVNPEHLESVTQQENVRRGNSSLVLKEKFSKARKCPQGHWMTGDNLYIHTTKKGHPNRMCRLCRSIRDKRAKELKRIKAYGSAQDKP